LEILCCFELVVALPLRKHLVLPVFELVLQK